MLVNGLAKFILQQSNVTAIIGNNIQRAPAPESLDDYPCVCYQMASFSTEYTFVSSTGVAKTRIVFDCFATDPNVAANIAQQLYSVLNGYSGTLPDGTVVYLTEIVNMMDGFVDQGKTLWRTSVHVMIQFAG